MTIRTTCIGAYPKPDYINVGNWSETEAQSEDQADARNFSYVTSRPDSDTEALLDRATREAVVDQVACGIDIPTDGEQRRENYIHYHCRHFEGIDFENLTIEVPEFGHALPLGAGRWTQTARGYDYTIVNGRVAVEAGRHTGRLVGSVIRGPNTPA